MIYAALMLAMLLATLDQTTPTPLMYLYFFLLGASLGLIIQVLVIAVQNTASYADLGAATSGVTFFRTIGGAFGVSVFGAIFTNQLSSKLTAALHGRSLPAGFSASSLEADTTALKRLPADLQHIILQAYSDALHPVFLTAVPIALIAFALSWFMREVPLRTVSGEQARGTSGAPDLGQALGAAPTQRTSAEEVERVMSRLSAVERAGSATPSWPGRPGSTCPAVPAGC